MIRTYIAFGRGQFSGLSGLDMARVEIYTRILCGYCAAAKHLLMSKGVEFEEHDASYSPHLRQQMTERAKGLATFPQIFIDGVHVGGSDDLHALDASGKLDPMLKEGG